MKRSSGCLWAAMKWSTIIALAVLILHWLTAGTDEITEPYPVHPSTQLETTR